MCDMSRRLRRRLRSKCESSKRNRRGIGRRGGKLVGRKTGRARGGGPHGRAQLHAGEEELRGGGMATVRRRGRVGGWRRV